MKITISLLLAGPVFAITTLAQSTLPFPPNNNEAAVVESCPDYRIWQSFDAVRTTTAGKGHMVKLATGMNYCDGNKWAASVAKFQLNHR